MASPRHPELPVLPFGFTEPSEKDLGALARTIVREADRNLEQRRHRSRLMLLPCLGVFLLFAVVLELPLWTRGTMTSGWPLALAVSAAFLLLGLLGQYYQGQASLSGIESGMSTRHSVLLLQALLIKAVTAAFFLVPYRVLHSLAHLAPRRPTIDPLVLTVAVQLAAALDLQLSLRQLQAVMPPELPTEVLEEALLLLQWSGLLQVIQHGGQTTVIPDDRVRRKLLSSPMQSAPVTRLSDLA